MTDKEKIKELEERTKRLRREVYLNTETLVALLALKDKP